MLIAPVYNISLLSGIPASVSDLPPLEPLPTRLYPLFSVGVHDMSTLSHGGRSSSTDSEGCGWIACTTDDILAQKSQLYDYVVHIPPSYSKQAKEKVWPRILSAKGAAIKATRRDLRRYNVLRRELTRIAEPSSPHATPGDLSRSLTTLNEESFDTDVVSALNADLVEPESWSALYVSGLVWWATAGENRIDMDEEQDYDAAFLRQIDPYRDSSPNRPRSARKSPGRGMEAGADRGPAEFEITLVAYFHRLTGLIMKTLADIVDDAASEFSSYDENGAAAAAADPESVPVDGREPDLDEELHGKVVVEGDDLARMGLDVWSESDRSFVKELLAFYWGREADVRGGRIECCGVRIC